MDTCITAESELEFAIGSAVFPARTQGDSPFWIIAPEPHYSALGSYRRMLGGIYPGTPDHPPVEILGAGIVEEVLHREGNLPLYTIRRVPTDHPTVREHLEARGWEIEVDGIDTNVYIRVANPDRLFRHYMHGMLLAGGRPWDLPLEEFENLHEREDMLAMVQHEIAGNATLPQDGDFSGFTGPQAAALFGIHLEWLAYQRMIQEIAFLMQIEMRLLHPDSPPEEPGYPRLTEVTHRACVCWALRTGFTVSDEVLADYPDLQAYVATGKPYLRTTPAPGCPSRARWKESEAGMVKALAQGEQSHTAFERLVERLGIKTLPGVATGLLEEVESRKSRLLTHLAEMRALIARAEEEDRLYDPFSVASRPAPVESEEAFEDEEEAQIN